MTTWREFVNQVKAEAGSRKTNEPRPLTEEDVEGFLKSANVRHTSIPTQNKQILLLKRTNFFRWHNMKKDFNWARKVLKKNGYDPEEVRWLL
jgi:hypothetical protein